MYFYAVTMLIYSEAWVSLFAWVSSATATQAQMDGLLTAGRPPVGICLWVFMFGRGLVITDNVDDLEAGPHFCNSSRALKSCEK